MKSDTDLHESHESGETSTTTQQYVSVSSIQPTRISRDSVEAFLYKLEQTLNRSTNLIEKCDWQPTGFSCRSNPGSSKDRIERIVAAFQHLAEGRGYTGPSRLDSLDPAYEKLDTPKRVLDLFDEFLGGFLSELNYATPTRYEYDGKRTLIPFYPFKGDGVQTDSELTRLRREYLIQTIHDEEVIELDARRAEVAKENEKRKDRQGVGRIREMEEASQGDELTDTCKEKGWWRKLSCRGRPD